ncbi:MAG: 4-hydroxy-tetrahydrodipicolinate reductase [Verrucomicrobia bacterium]|nr:4-hydroxy-tetrahydrodipicolinate reductase [Verrucomicrobiota bacterium]
MSTKILVTGSKGRMVQSILNCAQQDSEIEMAGVVETGQDLREHLQAGMVIVDFTSHAATPKFAQTAAEIGCPLIVGTTGFTYAERNIIASASKTVPIVMTPNMSVGVNLLFTITQIIASVLKEGFDVEIIEKHHRHRKDAPSGTASRLAEVVAEVKGLQVSKMVKHGRFGDLGERSADQIGIHSVRGGDFVGEHTVIFAGEGEILEVTHKANSRDVFAKGALLAAKWAATAQPGLYDMGDVLGLQVSHRPE